MVGCISDMHCIYNMHTCNIVHKLAQTFCFPFWGFCNFWKSIDIYMLVCICVLVHRFLSVSVHTHSKIDNELWDEIHKQTHLNYLLKFFFPLSHIHLSSPRTVQQVKSVQRGDMSIRFSNAWFHRSVDFFLFILNQLHLTFTIL